MNIVSTAKREAQAQLLLIPVTDLCSNLIAWKLDRGVPSKIVRNASEGLTMIQSAADTGTLKTMPLGVVVDLKIRRSARRG